MQVSPLRTRKERAYSGRNDAVVDVRCVIAYRIADARHPIYDGTGAMLRGGRWNSPGRPVIYAAETYAGAMLEILVHANLSAPPKHQQVVRIVIPETILVETVDMSALGGPANDLAVTRAFGDRWLVEARTAVLRVPSVVTQGREHTLVLNPLHPAAGQIVAGPPEPVAWDVRLFSGGR